MERRSLKWPITLGVVMILLLVLLTVGWVLLAVFGALENSRLSALYWTLLTVGTILLAFVLLGVVMYLSLTIKAINLNRRQSNFIDSVTHELKSPIASLKLYLQTLNRRHVSQEQQESFFRYMLEDVERLDELINHLLDAARLDKAEVEEDDVEEVELAALLRGCADSVCVRNRVAAETVHMEMEPCQVKARRVDLDMIFRNLLDNAIKYAGEQPEVEVTLRFDRHRGEAVTRVTDNGRGIPIKMRRKIFGRFVRLGLELEREKAGTGLGLYIVRTLIRRLRGAVRVHSRERGSGTVFEVRLPGQPYEASRPRADHPSGDAAEVA